jgi:hypothetical protein
MLYTYLDAAHALPLAVRSLTSPSPVVAYPFTLQKFLLILVFAFLASFLRHIPAATSTCSLTHPKASTMASDGSQFQKSRNIFALLAASVASSSRTRSSHPYTRLATPKHPAYCRTTHRLGRPPENSPKIRFVDRS